MEFYSRVTRWISLVISIVVAVPAFFVSFVIAGLSAESPNNPLGVFYFILLSPVILFIFPVLALLLRKRIYFSLALALASLVVDWYIIFQIMWKI